jgi:hypothetical protein
MENPIIRSTQPTEKPPQAQALSTPKSQAGQDYFVAQFDTSVEFSAMKRLQDPAKYKKAQFQAKLYQK